MDRIIVAALAIGVMAGPSQSFAEEAASSESKAKIEDVTGKSNTTSGQDVDELITNNKMRAETGSKSKWSMNSALSYNGGSIQKPFDERRPNIDGETGKTAFTAFTGQASAKYNLNPQNSLLAGVGVRWITPLQGFGKPTGYSGSKIDAENPYMTYQHVFKWSGVQSVFQATPTFYTNSDRVREGYVANMRLISNNIYEVGTTGLSLGLYGYVQGNAYNKTGPLGNPKDADYQEDVRDGHSDYQGGLSPFLEYQLTSKVNLRTVSNVWIFEHMRKSRAHTYVWDKVTQSVGVGIAVTRDIFLYPNLQFLPDDIRADRTNVALNADINLF